MLLERELTFRRRVSLVDVMIRGRKQHSAKILNHSRSASVQNDPEITEPRDEIWCDPRDGCGWKTEGNNKFQVWV